MLSSMFASMFVIVVTAEILFFLFFQQHYKFNNMKIQNILVWLY